MPVDFSDIEATEPEYGKILKQILITPLEHLMMDLTFSAEIQKFGRTEVMDLIPDGRNVAVTDENKAEYVRLVAHHRMTTAIRSQIDSFLTGFYDIVPPDLISIFSPAELELLICGLPDVISLLLLMRSTSTSCYLVVIVSVAIFIIIGVMVVVVDSSLNNDYHDYYLPGECGGVAEQHRVPPVQAQRPRDCVVLGRGEGLQQRGKSLFPAVRHGNQQGTNYLLTHHSCCCQT